MQIDLQKYTQFVQAITSQDSDSTDKFVERLELIQHQYPEINMSLLLTSAMGMSGEAGEFSEIVKKIMFHSKPITPELQEHMAKELGDQVWYWTNACRALGLDPNQVIANNVSKLESRYPGGTFNAASSETRAAGDI